MVCGPSSLSQRLAIHTGEDLGVQLGTERKPRSERSTLQSYGTQAGPCFLNLEPERKATQFEPSLQKNLVKGKSAGNFRRPNQLAASASAVTTPTPAPRESRKHDHHFSRLDKRGGDLAFL